MIKQKHIKPSKKVP